ncbi:hypothetical protein TRFO_12367 [Tritrichomonas foetus]|uniref:Uncharacterized protein n=1 Tax=Tritrichomonas foetus TaxID=1144522 RepID=A0A1J4L1U6_9EUKA|nr:hypothetical protein TRFO_12367 [Tritrichomonas foetus]|eukprot:OHT17411.1 hypothetical protein TRFO_12367 [Tritrichomonas foetus]
MSRTDMSQTMSFKRTEIDHNLNNRNPSTNRNNNGSINNTHNTNVGDARSQGNLSLTLPRGNIMDGLTLAQQQARENELRHQRSLNPSLNGNISTKRAAQSRLQVKRQTQSQNRGNARNQPLGWSS